MALRFMDGFDGYTSNSNGGLKWTFFNTNLTIQTTVARNGNSVKADNANRTFAKTLDNQATWILGFGFHYATANQIIIVNLQDAGSDQCGLRVNTDGTLQVVRGTSTALNASGTSSLSLSLNTWYYIEWKVTIADSISASTCKVNVNGVNWINVDSGQDLKATANAQANRVVFIPNSNIIMNIYFDDIYILDGTGSANNDLLGDMRVETLFPDGAGNSSQWTADSGTNYTRVNEANPDTSSYVQTSGVNNIDLYTFGNLSSTPTSIAGIMVNNFAEKTDAGARQFANVIRLGGTNYVNSNNHNPTAMSYLDHTQIYEQDPSTSAAWGTTNINAMEVGYKLTT